MIAFAIAPLWIVLYAILFGIMAWTHTDPILSEMTAAELIGTAGAAGFTVAYILMVIAGLPCHLLLKAKRLERLHHYVISAFVCGVALRFISIAATWLWIAYQDNLQFGIVGKELRDAVLHQPTRLLIFGLVGALVGATFWLIARPDLQQSTKD
ncbi:hypothetical protein BJF95_09040 [Rhizobium oryziradicis]|uniref:Uncharacterized protein n=2 Tax=Rhizobium oryziradicis TaxID=1867956 RepID=A0A1Q8ZRD1_9HYPH|nr:hypothetical protein BJF95_09040 [Rhizobium oryziradicis]